MSPSPAQQSASRLNGAASFGPVTAEGKARSSQNARKHDFFTSTALLPSEDRAQFDELLAAFTEEHQPATFTERRYVREMADAEFRLMRVRNSITQIQWKTMQAFENPTEAAAEAFDKLANEGKSLQLALRYERHFQRQFDSALKTLLQLKRQAAATHRAKAKQAQADHLKALEEYFLSPTPGELYGYGDEPLQNEPANQPNRC
ncbi:MAG: hypothetical protein JST93_00870 [Acidobacteria bacterium]|nr:hypothetical protein [Acidobacteriota bacterium]